MPGMPNMLAYTVKGSRNIGDPPTFTVGQHATRKGYRPTNPLENSYWFYFLDRNNPQNLVHDVSVPGNNNSVVPAGIDTYMSNPNLIFGMTTQSLSLISQPQGAFYDYLVKYGAGRELQKMEQVGASMGCGYYGMMSYILTGQGGPRGPIPPATYEMSDIRSGILFEMSFMPLANGQPPYSLCDSYTFQ